MIEYQIAQEHLDQIKDEKDVLVLLMKHSFESFVFSVRTGEINYALARELGFNRDEAVTYFLCGLYHDVGKLGMPKFLIDYPGRYTDEMRKEMQKHTAGGEMLLKKTKANPVLVETAKYHHCNYDGSGYLEPLKEDEIPFHARLTRVSDSADAYLSWRSYKPGYKVFGLYDNISQFSGTWYEPDIVSGLKNMHQRILNKSTTPNNEITQDEYMYLMKNIYEMGDIVDNHISYFLRNA